MAQIGKTRGKAQVFNFQQMKAGTGNAPALQTRSSRGALPPAPASATQVGSHKEPQFRPAASASPGAISATATAGTTTPLGLVKGIPVYWGPACGKPLPAGIVLRPESINNSEASAFLIPSQGGTFNAVSGQLAKFDQKGLDGAAEAASKNAKAKTGGANTYSASVNADMRRQFVLVKVPKDSAKAPERLARALDEAAKSSGLTDPQNKTLATTWLGAGKADAGHAYSQAQLDALCDWQQAQAGRTVEICDIDPAAFTPLCQYLTRPASLPEAQQTRIQEHAEWMANNDSQIKLLGNIRQPGGKSIPVWAFAGTKGRENTAAIQGKTGLILAFDTDAMKVSDDTAFLYAHKPGLAIGKKGMAGHLRDMAEGTDFIDKDCKDALKAANEGKELKPSQAVLVPLPPDTGQLRGKAIVLVNGPKVGKGDTTPEHARDLETSIDNSIALASENGIRSVAVTGISTGEFGFDKVWGGNTITQTSIRALQEGTVDTVIACFWGDKGLTLEQSVPGGAMAAVFANPLFEAES